MAKSTGILKPIVRQRVYRIPIYLNKAELDGLELIINDFNKRTEAEPLAGRLMDRSSIIRYLIIKAAKSLRKRGH